MAALVTDGVMGKQQGGVAADHELEHDKVGPTDDAEQHPDVQRSLNDDSVELPDVRVDAPSTTIRLMAAKYRDWGLRVDADTDSAIQVALNYQVDGQNLRDQAVSHYEAERDATIDLIEPAAPRRTGRVVIAPDARRSERTTRRG